MALSPPFPSFCFVSSRSGAGRSISQTAALGAAALTLAGGAAEAAPTQANPEFQSPTWTLAEAVASAPRPAAVAIPAPAAPVATMASTSEPRVAPTSARWASVVGQIQSHTSAPYASGQCCFSDAGKTARFRRRSPDSMLLMHDNDDARETQQFYLLLILTLWFGATAPWILRQFWLSQQRMSYGRYGYAVRRSRTPARRSSLYKSKHDRAVPLTTSRAKAGRFAQPRVPVTAQDWVNEWEHTMFKGTEKLVYEALPVYLVKKDSTEEASVSRTEKQWVTRKLKLHSLASG